MSDRIYEIMDDYSHLGEIYLLPENQHVSYLIDYAAYNTLFNYIRKLMSDELIEKYMFKDVFTGYSYNPEANTFHFDKSYKNHPVGSIPLYLNLDIQIEGSMASSVNYDSDVLPEKIIIYFNSIRLNEKYSEIITNFGKFQSDNDIEKVKTIFKQYVIGCLDHEFLHIRQSYMTKLGKKRIGKYQKHLKEIKNYLSSLNTIDLKAKENIFKMFYYLSPVETEARVSSTARYFENSLERQRARDILSKNIETIYKPKNTEKDKIEKEIKFVKERILKNNSSELMEVCIKMTYNLNSLDDINDIVRYIRNSKKAEDIIYQIDNSFHLNFFKDGIDKVFTKYKAMLMRAIYGVFDKNKPLVEAKLSIDYMYKVFETYCKGKVLYY